MEHHSNIVPWQIICAERGATLRVIPMNQSGELLLDEYERLLSPRTKLVRCALSNSLGTIIRSPNRGAGARARRGGAGGTAAQAAPHMRSTSRPWVRFLHGLGSKMFGRRASACCMAARSCSRRSAVTRAAADMIRSVTSRRRPTRRFRPIRGWHTAHRRRDSAWARHRLPGAASTAQRPWRTKATCWRTPSSAGRGSRRPSWAPRRAAPACVDSCSTAVTRTTSGTIVDQEGWRFRTAPLHPAGEGVLRRAGDGPGVVRFYNTRADADALAAAVARSAPCSSMADLRELLPDKPSSSTTRSPAELQELGDANRPPRQQPLCGDHITLYVRLDAT